MADIDPRERGISMTWWHDGAIKGLSLNEIGCARISMMVQEQSMLHQRAGYRRARPVSTHSPDSACNAWPVPTVVPIPDIVSSEMLLTEPEREERSRSGAQLC